MIDTNVLSELSRPRPDERVAAWLRDTPSASKFVSVLTFGEIRRGVERERLRDVRRAAKLERWLTDLVEAFGSRMLPVDATTADRWGRFSVSSPVPAVDALIAATALAHGLTVVTRNVRDFERCGVATINPFS